MNPLDETVRDMTFWPQLQIEFNRACNAVCRRDKRLTQWERKFLDDLMKKCGNDTMPRHLSDKQMETIRSIAAKLPDVVGF